MINRLIIFWITAALGTTLAAQAPGMPKPGPEQQYLERLVGTWKMEGTMKAGPMGPGGAFTGSETCRMFDGGFHLVCDTTGSGSMGDMKGHMLLSYDRIAKTYRYFAINNGPDAELAAGTFANNAWTFNSEMDMGGKKMWSRLVITEASPTLRAFTWQMSEDGKTWTAVMEGKSTRQ